ncbi:MAG: hypothetical protein J6V14_01880 [Clostridia bacterium]|nr:hypothetical protein [Clostridia bacterium]
MKKRAVIKILALILTGILLAALCACNGSQLNEPTEKPEATEPAAVVTDEAPDATDEVPEATDMIPDNTDGPAATDNATQPADATADNTAGTDTDAPKASPTPPVPTDPADDPAYRASVFCGRFNGTWTASDDSFIDFSMDDKLPTALFGAWGSSASFPQGQIEDAIETAENEYDLTIRMTPQSNPVTMHCKSDNNAIIFTDAMSVTKRYEYDGNRQYPLSIDVLTPQEIMTLFGGLWTEALEGKEFLYIDMINTGSIIIKVGEWGTEGYKTGYSILRVEADSAWEKFELTLEDVDGKLGIYPGALYNAMNTLGIDFGGGEKAYNADDYANHLNDAEDARRRALEFAFKVDGTWNTLDGPVFMDFDIEGNEAWFMTAVWNSGGEFPSGHILDAVEKSAGDYELTVQMRGDDVKRKMRCKISGYTMEFTDDSGDKKTLSYDPYKQYPSYITDALRSSILSICGGVRTEATQRIDYLNVFEDSAGRVIMNRCAWGVDGIKARYRVVKIEYTNDVGTELNIILADDNYNVYDCPGRLMGADQIFHIDFGDGMRAYVEDFPENHTLEVNPDTAEKRALEFAFLVDGTWNNKEETEFVDFEINDKNEPWFMLAIWNSGGEFPSGRIMDAVKVKDGEYDVTIKMRNETTTHKVRAKLNGNRLDFIDPDFKSATYYYNAEKQFPSSREDIPRNQIMTYAGGVRTEAKYGKMYIHVYEDGNGNIWLDRCVWGVQGISARYRIVKIEALDMLYHELNIILVDGKYNVYQCPGKILSADMILHIDFGDGMYAYLEDSYENH